MKKGRGSKTTAKKKTVSKKKPAKRIAAKKTIASKIAPGIKKAALNIWDKLTKKKEKPASSAKVKKEVKAVKKEIPKTVKKTIPEKNAARTGISKLIADSKKRTEADSPSNKTSANSVNGNGRPRAVDHAVRSHLPFSYNETLIALLVRDPHWGYAYRDFSQTTWDWMQSILKRDPKTRVVLRVHNLDENRFYDITVHIEAKNWYIEFGLPNTSFQVEIGLIDSTGKFYRIAISNKVRTPRNGPSQVVDPSWHPDYFDEIYSYSGGGKIGRSSDLFSRMKSISQHPN